MSIGELTDLMRKWGAVPADWRHFMEELERATIDTDKVLEERSAQLLETARKLAEAEARIEELESVLSGCHEWFFRYQPTANIRRPGGRPTPAVTTIQDTLSTGIT